MLVLGTAGHVDHGKSTLVTALTGMDPDRWAEEKRRGLTIDLGFAWMEPDAPDAERRIGLVDVPGHLDFIRNMLAGVSGLDAALLVVAADEGVMPQTREHLAILDLLDVPLCLPVVTKIDAVEDPELIELAELECAEALARTKFAQAPLRRVSAVTGEGVAELARAIRALERNKASRLRATPPRLPIDRVFTRSGFGTVVTGTLASGRLTVGAAVEVQPGKRPGRIRGLQAYRQSVSACAAGTRVAANLGGISHADVRRGQVLCLPDTFQATQTVEVSLRLWDAAPQPVTHDMEVMVFQGAAEVMARIRLIGGSEIRPGETGYCQLVTAAPVVMARGDRCIVRLPSPSYTLGGGQVLAAPSRRYWKRFAPATLAHFQAWASPDLGVQVRQALTERPLQSADDLRQAFPERRDALDAVLQDAVARGVVAQVRADSESLYVVPSDLDAWAHFARTELTRYHRRYPLRRGQPRKELQSRLAVHVRRQKGMELEPTLCACLVQQWLDRKQCQRRGHAIALPGHAVVYSQAQRQATATLAQAMDATPFSPPARQDILAILRGDRELLDSLMEAGTYVQAGPDVIFSRRALDAMQAKVAELIAANGAATLAEVRDALATSRKYGQALLEWMDAERITRRQGDARVLI